MRVTTRSGYEFRTESDPVYVDGKNINEYDLVPKKSKSCHAEDSKPSTYTHKGALNEATNQLDLAQRAVCAGDQNKHIRRAQELLAYVEAGTRQKKTTR